MYGKTGGISIRTDETFVKTGAISDPVPAPGKLRRTDVMFGKTEAICEKIIEISGRIGKTGAKTVGIFVTTWPAAEATDAKHS
jgi:hypothetical protein